VGSAWRSLVKELSTVKPTSFEEAMSEPFWWLCFLATIGLGFAKVRAAQLHQASLQQILDAWDNDYFMSANTTIAKSGLKNSQFGAWQAVTLLLTRTLAGVLGEFNLVVDPCEWLGIFNEQVSALPKAVFQACNIPSLIVGSVAQDWYLLTYIDIYEVLPISCCY
jgi:hypothetical protein